MFGGLSCRFFAFWGIVFWGKRHMSHGILLDFLFTENLKTPWLCGYYIRMVILWRAVLHKVKTLLRMMAEDDNFVSLCLI